MKYLLRGLAHINVIRYAAFMSLMGLVGFALTFPVLHFFLLKNGKLEQWLIPEILVGVLSAIPSILFVNHAIITNKPENFARWITQ